MNRHKTTIPEAPKRPRSKRKKPRRKSRRGFLYFLVGAVLAAALYCFVLFYYFVDPYSFQWKAIYGETQYPEGYTVRGIDISHYQDRIDWQQLRNASMDKDPVTFVIIKATEGVSLFDDNFNENFYEARRNDFVRGAYHFLTPDVSARKQAEFFLHQVHLEKGDLPPVLDIENKKKWKDKSNTEIQQMALTWLNVVEKRYGVRPIIYTSVSFRQDVLTDPVFDTYPFWMAHYYVQQPTYSGNWLFWQHTDRGRIKGIKEFVDCNIYRGSRESLDSLLISEID